MLIFLTNIGVSTVEEELETVGLKSKKMGLEGNTYSYDSPKCPPSQHPLNVIVATGL